MIRKAWKIVYDEANHVWFAEEWEVDDRSTPLQKTGEVTATHLSRQPLETDLLRRGVGHQDLIGD